MHICVDTIKATKSLIPQMSINPILQITPYGMNVFLFGCYVDPAITWEYSVNEAVIIKIKIGVAHDILQTSQDVH